MLSFSSMIRKSTIRQFQHTIRQFKQAFCLQEHTILHFETVVLQFKRSTLQFRPTILLFQRVIFQLRPAVRLWRLPVVKFYNPVHHFKCFSYFSKHPIIQCERDIRHLKFPIRNFQTLIANTLSIVVTWNLAVHGGQ